MNNLLALGRIIEMDSGQKATLLHKALNLISVSMEENSSWLDNIPFLPERFRRFISPARIAAMDETLMFCRSVNMLMESEERLPPEGVFEQLHQQWFGFLGEELDLSSLATTPEP